MAASQDLVFRETEGDRWFQRNKAHLESLDLAQDVPLRVLDLYGVRPRKVLEVGAANGWRAAAVARKYGCEVVALEPSGEAIAAGRSAYPEVRFVQGSGCELPRGESFDLVLVNSVFHWVDRSTLLRSCAEIDRVLADGGYLLIGDFYPANAVKVRYHHRQDVEVYTYKQDYAAIFLATGLYLRVALLSFDHAGRALRGDVAEEERFAVSLLRKQAGGLAAERPLPRSVTPG